MDKSMITIAFVVDPEQNILFLHRTDRDEREPVKGGIEEWESPDQATRRELYEETWLAPDHISHTNILDPAYNTNPHWIAQISILHTKQIQPSVQINHDEIGGIDHDAYQRIPVDKMEKYLNKHWLKETIQWLVNTIQNP